MHADLLIQNARLPDGRRNIAVVVEKGRIAAIGDPRDAHQIKAREVIDAQDYLLSPPFVDPHFHLDSALSYGQPRINESGTLLEGIELWGELRPTLTIESVRERVRNLLSWSIARGTLAIRSHVDIGDPNLTAVHALIEVRESLKDLLDIQLVAFPQDGYLRNPGAARLLDRALELGVDVVGGIPHFERAKAEGDESVRLLCELAANKGLMVDMHCDESDDPHSRHIETLASQTVRLGLEGRVTGSHVTAMHSMDNYYVSKLLPLLRDADLSIISNPLINLCLQGRHDNYPRRRGLTRIKELLDAGINLALGHDCVMDPWYPLGSHDMLEVAHMAVHGAPMTSLAQMRDLYDAVTIRGAAAMNLKDYGLAVGNPAHFVILQARTPLEAIRLRPARLFVVRAGQVISRTPPVYADVAMGEKTHAVDFCFEEPAERANLKKMRP